MSFTPYPKDSDFIILKGVPLDAGYRNTLFFTSAGEQQRIMLTYAKYTFTDQSFQRVDSGVMRIAQVADNLYDCNYMMFKNSAYGNKWFYAFITDISYVNDHATEIHYELDLMQTWMFDYTLKACFVEREHSLSDHYGENFVEEGLGTGEYIIRSKGNYQYGYNSYSQNGEWIIMVEYTHNSQENVVFCDSQGRPTFYWDGSTANYPTPQRGDAIGELLNGVPCGYMYLATPLNAGTAIQLRDTALAIQGIIDGIINDIKGEVVNIRMIPRQIADDYGIITSPGDSTWVQQPPAHSYEFTQSTDFKMMNFNENNYVPKNKKLYQYPYRQLVVSNNQGETAEYRWEAFRRTDATDAYKANFAIYSFASPDGYAHLVPQAYRGWGGEDWEMGLTVGGFPTISWSESSFAKWWNTNKDTWTMGLISTAIHAVTGYNLSRFTTESNISNTLQNARDRYQAKVSSKHDYRYIMTGARREAQTMADVGQLERINILANAGIDICNSLAQLSGARAVPDTCQGKQTPDPILMREERYGFTFYDMQITGEYAKIIDDYFSMYGYAVKRVKVPNIAISPDYIRPNWNYIQTRGCNALPKSGSGLNAEDLAKICKIYDTGITFWSTQDVGNYSLNNSALL